MTANGRCAGLTPAGFPTGAHSGTESHGHLAHKATGPPAQCAAPVHGPHGTALTVQTALGSARLEFTLAKRDCPEYVSLENVEIT